MEAASCCVVGVKHVSCQILADCEDVAALLCGQVGSKRHLPGLLIFVFVYHRPGAANPT